MQAGLILLVLIGILTACCSSQPTLKSSEALEVCLQWQPSFSCFVIFAAIWLSRLVEDAVGWGRTELALQELVHDAPLTFSPTLAVAIFLSWCQMLSMLL